MVLKGYLSNEQIEICNSIGLTIESGDYTSEELLSIERSILEYINDHCAEEDFYNIEEDLDNILDIVMDLESESDELIPTNNDEIYENDHVKLNNGKVGVVVDATNNVYTIEVDEEFRTGNIDDDIMIVAQNSIVGKV